MNNANKIAIAITLLILFSVISFKFLGKKYATNEPVTVYYSAEIPENQGYDYVDVGTGSGDE